MRRKRSRRIVQEKRSTYKIPVFIAAGVVFVLIALGVFLKMTHTQPPQAQPKRNILGALTSGASIYWGVYLDNVPQIFSVLTTFEATVGKPVSIVMWYQDWNSGSFQPTWMDQVRNHGSIPLISWEPWNYQNGVNQPAYQLKNIYTGTYDAYIAQWAQDAKTWGHPFFMRFAYEMNGNWYPWSEQVNGNMPGEYVKAWQHVHDIFTANGVTNVTWVWSPNIESSTTTPLTELYPGDAYVDWVGIDGYNWGTTLAWTSWQSFSQLFSQTYNDIQQIAPTKPEMVAETASTEFGGDKPSWITDTFITQLPSYFPNIKAVIWFNANKETDWRVESSLASLQAFQQAIAPPYYTSNQYANLNNTPIKPPQHQARGNKYSGQAATK